MYCSIVSRPSGLPGEGMPRRFVFLSVMGSNHEKRMEEKENVVTCTGAFG